MSDRRPLLFATESAATSHLVREIDAELAPLPPADAPDTFAAWRTQAAQGAARDRVVVAPWLDTLARAELRAIDTAAWRQRFETHYLRWNFALGAAARRCADGGAIVAVVQTPAGLDAAGWTPEFAVAEGVLALVRSVAAAEGARGVRANLVTTPIGMSEASEVAAPLPPLPGFPGTIEGHVAGAVRALLSPDTLGLTGRRVSADGGRAL